MKFIIAALMLCSISLAHTDKRIQAVHEDAAKQGLNLTFEMSEFGYKYATGLVKPLGGKTRAKRSKKFLVSTERLPAKFQLSEHLALTKNTKLCGIYDQGNCGSCVYNSIAKNFCDSLRIRDIEVPDFLSRQELMSCTSGGRCNGEWALNVAGYLKQLGGLHDESVYPYAASSSGTCKKVQGIKYGQIEKGYEIDRNHKSMFTALYQGYPLSVTVGADNAWMGYQKGVYNYCSNAGTNHEVLIYGWDCESAIETVDGKDYCVFDAKGNLPKGVGIVSVPNSWSPNWGEQGIMRTKLTSASGKLCNNLAEEVVVLETGIPMPEVKPDPSPTPDPTPIPPTPPAPEPTPAMPSWVLVAAVVMAGILVGFAALFKSKK